MPYEESSSTAIQSKSTENRGISEYDNLTSIFALSSGSGSVKISSELMTNASLRWQLPTLVSSNIDASNTSFSELKIPLTSRRGSYLGQIKIQKLSQYFETHYKYTYAIRTSQNLKLEYLRLPQSSIHKNE